VLRSSMFAEMQVLFLWQAGFEKMEVTGRFELPEELLDLERSGLLESAAFDRSRAHRAVSTAPSPLLGPQDPLRTTSAQGGYSLYDESSRCVCILPSMLCCLCTLLISACCCSTTWLCSHVSHVVINKHLLLGTSVANCTDCNFGQCFILACT